MPPPGDFLLEHPGLCRECSSPLAVDQRWCVECGTRRGPVSDAMQAFIAGTVPPTEIEPAPVAEPSPAGPLFRLPTPRVAAVATTCILAFGVVLGSVVSPAAESSAQSPIVVAVSSPPPAPAPAPAEAPADDTSSSDTAVADTPAEAPPAVPQTVDVPAPAETTPTPARPKPLPVPPLPPLPSVSHVFVVMLSGHGFNAAFGPDSPATYLSKTLTTHGELIPNYYGIAHGGLDNEIALVSGQGPTKQTAANCPDYGDVMPGTAGDKDQATGDGCIYPTETKTLADQLFMGGNAWKAYVEDFDKGSKDCKPNDAYAAWRNPFIYFHSLIDSPACASNFADTPQLATDLQQVGDTPALSYIVPNRCHDGSDNTDPSCPPDQPHGLAAADAWLQTVIPQIEDSAGYKQGGLIAITFDAAPKDGPEADSTACCGQPDQYPNLPADDPSQQPTPPQDPNAQPAPTARAADESATPTKPSGGGGKVGLLLISPYVTPNTVNDTGYYNHFSLFASIEDLFAIGHIAYGNLPDLTTFDKTVYTAYNTDGG